MGLGSKLKKAVKKAVTGVAKIADPGYVGKKIYETGKKGWEDITGVTAANKALEAQNAQNAANLEMWRLQNEYNTPANQMQRWLEAGLNPNLIYSEGNPGNASSAPEVDKSSTYQSSAGKILSLLETFIGLKGALENQSLEKAKTLNAIEHSQDALEFQKRQFAVDSAFRNTEIALREKELGLSQRWHDRQYELMKDKLNFQLNHGGGTVGWFDRATMAATGGKNTTDVITDTSNMLKRFAQNGFYNAMQYSKYKGVSGNALAWIIRMIASM